MKSKKRVWGVPCETPNGVILQVGIASNFRTINDGKNQYIVVDVKTALYGTIQNIRYSTLFS